MPCAHDSRGAGPCPLVCPLGPAPYRPVDAGIEQTESGGPEPEVGRPTCASVSGMTEPSAAVLDEQALLQGLRERRPEAFDSLVRAYTPRLLAVARRMLGSDEDARDAV